MKTATLLTAIIVGFVGVESVGVLLNPPPRPITDDFRRDLPPTIRGLSDSDIQKLPNDYVRKNFGQDTARKFKDISGPCGGVPRQPGRSTRAVIGRPIRFDWNIENSDSNARCKLVLTCPNKATERTLWSGDCRDARNYSQDVVIPRDVGPCGEGECYFQWSMETKSDKFCNCADVTIEGPPFSSSSSSASTSTSLSTSTSTSTSTSLSTSTSTITSLSTSTRSSSGPSTSSRRLSLSSTAFLSSSMSTFSTSTSTMTAPLTTFSSKILTTSSSSLSSKKATSLKLSSTISSIPTSSTSVSEKINYVSSTISYPLSSNVITSSMPYPVASSATKIINYVTSPTFVTTKVTEKINPVTSTTTSIAERIASITSSTSTSCSESAMLTCLTCIPTETISSLTVKINVISCTTCTRKSISPSTSIFSETGDTSASITQNNQSPSSSASTSQFPTATASPSTSVSTEILTSFNTDKINTITLILSSKCSAQTQTMTEIATSTATETLSIPLTVTEITTAISLQSATETATVSEGFTVTAIATTTEKVLATVTAAVTEKLVESVTVINLQTLTATSTVTKNDVSLIPTTLISTMIFSEKNLPVTIYLTATATATESAHATTVTERISDIFTSVFTERAISVATATQTAISTLSCAPTTIISKIQTTYISILTELKPSKLTVTEIQKGPEITVISTALSTSISTKTLVATATTMTTYTATATAMTTATTTATVTDISTSPIICTLKEKTITRYMPSSSITFSSAQPSFIISNKMSIPSITSVYTPPTTTRIIATTLSLSTYKFTPTTSMSSSIASFCPTPTIATTSYMSKIINTSRSVIETSTSTGGSECQEGKKRCDVYDRRSYNECKNGKWGDGIKLTEADNLQCEESSGQVRLVPIAANVFHD